MTKKTPEELEREKQERFLDAARKGISWEELKELEQSRNCSPNYIYAICDPDTEEVKYIGQTSGELVARLSAHIGKARRAKANQTDLGYWIMSIIDQGKMPKIKVVEEVFGDINAAERRWITKMLDDGRDLTNTVANYKSVKWKNNIEQHRQRITKKNAMLATVQADSE
mgnify:CR=1 FL=1